MKVVNVFDLGYKYVEKDYPEQLSFTPYRKKRNSQYLAKKQKEYNKGHSQKRIIIDYAISRLKKYRNTCANIFRNKLRKYDKVLDIVLGLVNYRIINHYN